MSIATGAARPGGLNNYGSLSDMGKGYMPELDNGGIKHDNGKTQYHLLEWSFIEQMAKILTFGAGKYGAENWKEVANGEDRYFDALHRHIIGMRSDNPIDEETGIPHSVHAGVNLMFIHFLQGREIE